MADQLRVPPPVAKKDLTLWLRGSLADTHSLFETWVMKNVNCGQNKIRCAPKAHAGNSVIITRTRESTSVFDYVHGFVT